MVRLNSVFCLSLCVVVLSGCAAKYADFGDPMKKDTAKVATVSDVLKDPSPYADEYLRVKGTVSSVCAKKGCWLRMGAGGDGETIFVKFTCPVEGRLIPMDAVGHNAIVEGRLQIEEMSEADARHMAEDAGKSAEEIAKIVGPQKSIRMASPSARVMGIATDS